MNLESNLNEESINNSDIGLGGIATSGATDSNTGAANTSIGATTGTTDNINVNTNDNASQDTSFLDKVVRIFNMPFTKLITTAGDENMYILKLNHQSNATYLAIMVLVLGIVYIIIIYLFSFLFIPIDTIATESNMFSSLIFNPDSTVNVFHKFIKSNVRDGFSNISNNSTIQNIREGIDIYIEKVKSFIHYWFHRMLLFFHIKNGTIKNTKKINRVSFMDLTY